MAQHRLSGWTLVFDNAKTRAGACRSDRREIALSRHLMALYSPGQVTETVLHEIAHALAGPRHGHDQRWRTIARRIGCSGQRCMPADAPRVDGAWVGTCPAGHRTTTHRRPVRVRSCPECSPRFDVTARYTWTHRDGPAAMDPRYDRELARLLTPRPRPAVTSVAAVGDRVRVIGGGKYAGLTGTVEKRGRSRYQVRTREGLLNVPFAAAQPVTASH
ncbi:SprT-like domain-containing protein [Actinoplanes bogorensis]|uniref:SprT-like domain-containing protein n=2 Tax=Paractinoplanes bogorensis TaxID=1610840 RepID=A0ABS5Z5S7_9ACTN|nr:SprT-like domain-containing protein [Actinoplanes bogorensis]